MTARADVGRLSGWWATDVSGWAWSLRPGPYEGPAAGYAAVLDMAGREPVFVRHRIVLGVGACRFASRVVVPAVTVAVFPAVAVNPYRRLRDLEAVLAAEGCRPTLTTSTCRAVCDRDLAAVFGVEPGSTCHRVTLTLHHPDSGRPLALGDHLSGWTRRPTHGRTSPTVTHTRRPESPRTRRPP